MPLETATLLPVALTSYSAYAKLCTKLLINNNFQRLFHAPCLTIPSELSRISTRQERVLTAATSLAENPEKRAQSLQEFILAITRSLTH